MAKGRFSVVRVSEGETASPLGSSLFSVNSLSGFVYKRTLGEGGYGKVYLASYGDNVYAIKVAPKRFSGKPTCEYLTLSKSQHPFIVKLHHHHIGLQKEYFVLDFCGGGDMRTLLNRFTFFSESQSAFYGAEILSGLSYLHDVLTFAYRDLKPSNILVDARGHVKLTDFGLSLPLSSHVKRAKLSGTTEYMSPESFTSLGHPNHVKDDIWAFGVLLYEFLTGERPFDDARGVKSLTIRNILNCDYNIPEGLSPECKAVLRDIFVLEPARPASADDVFEVYGFFGAYHRLSAESLSRLPAPFDPMLRSEDDVTHFEFSSFEDNDKRILCQ